MDMDRRRDTSSRNITVIGRRFGIVDEIGRGNQSTVYRARDLERSNEIVAVKVFNTAHPDHWRETFFNHEIDALGRLRHRNIVHVRDSGRDPTRNLFYVALDYIDGTLERYISEKSGPEFATERLSIMRTLAEAVSYAHSEGVIHRDLKPSNILVRGAATPVITDFGTSRIRYEFAVGETVVRFQSPGYTAPERATGDRGTPQSDIYSLGAVYYHLLSGTAPPGEGLSAADIDQLAVPASLRRILRRMLATDPKERYTDAIEAFRELSAISDYGELPRVLLQIMPEAWDALHRFGEIADSSFEAARDWLFDHWIGRNIGPVTVASGGPSRKGALVLLDDYQVVCSRAQSLPALTIEVVEKPDKLTLDRGRDAAMPFRARWDLRESGVQFAPGERTVFERGLEDLLRRLSEHDTERRVESERRHERNDYMDGWQHVLRFHRRLLEAEPGARYVAVKDEGDHLIFTLQQALPRSLTWQRGNRLAMKESEEAREEAVGSLVDSFGKTVTVAKDVPVRRDGPRREGALPRTGLLLLSHGQKLSALSRQENAVSLLKHASTANPRLVDVLRDLSRAQFDDPRDRPPYQELSDDKQAAVRLALSARDIALIQGPPGTGKTRAIAEMILQIRADDPNARILVSSQSNVAVDNVLAAIDKIDERPDMTIVRIGREGKIGAEAERYSVERGLTDWRGDVLRRCGEYVAELDGGGGELGTAAMSQADIDAFVESMSEAGRLVQLLRDEDEELPMIAADENDGADESDFPALAGDLEGGDDGRAVAQADEGTRRELDDYCRAMRDALPPQERGEPRENSVEEYERLVRTMRSVVGRDASDDRPSQIRAMVREWCAIFGKTPEFEGPLIRRADVVAATCLYAGAGQLRNQYFEWAIVDEAARATAPEALVPLARSERIILVGDEKQLPPQLDDDLTQERLAAEDIQASGLEVSLFEALVTQAKAKRTHALRMLKRQHRMHPAIGRLISDVFYKGDLENATTAEERAHGLPVGVAPRPVVWYSTSALDGRYQKRRGKSYANPTEATVVREIVARIEESYRELATTPRPQVVVISPYLEQVEELKRRLNPGDEETWQGIALEVATVDSIQGRDCDVVVCSLVRTNPENIGFLADRRRLNVALSRAKRLLCVVGDATALEKAWTPDGDNVFREVLNHMSVTKIRGEGHGR